MTTPTSTPIPDSAPAPAHAAEPAAPAPPVVADRFESPVPVANAALIGLPTFLVGSIALALNLTNYVAQGIIGAPIAVIALATGAGLTIATIFALRAGESAVASVFAIFAGFWLSYAAFVLGVLHNWYALGADGLVPTVKAFLLTWLILIGLLTLVSLRLPSAFTLLFLLVDGALLFVLLGYYNLSSAGAASESLLKVGGYFVWAFVVVGAYLFLDAMSAATGGKNLPLGRAVLT